MYQVASSNKTHGIEVDPTGIEGLSNFSLVVDLVKRIKIWLMVLWLTELNCIEVKRTRNKWLKLKEQETKWQKLKVQEM